MQEEEEEASSETQSTQSGRENWREEHGRKPLGTDSHQTISKT